MTIIEQLKALETKARESLMTLMKTEHIPSDVADECNRAINRYEQALRNNARALIAVAEAAEKVAIAAQTPHSDTCGRTCGYSDGCPGDTDSAIETLITALSTLSKGPQ